MGEKKITFQNQPANLSPPPFGLPGRPHRRIFTPFLFFPVPPHGPSPITWIFLGKKVRLVFPPPFPFLARLCFPSLAHGGRLTKKLPPLFFPCNFLSVIPRVSKIPLLPFPPPSSQTFLSVIAGSPPGHKSVFFPPFFFTLLHNPFSNGSDTRLFFSCCGTTPPLSFTSLSHSGGGGGGFLRRRDPPSPPPPFLKSVSILPLSKAILLFFA